MKNLIKKLPALAFILAVAGAFAFNQPVETTTVWFELDTNGDVLNEMPASFTCEGDARYCAVEVDETKLDQNGEPTFDNVHDTGAEYIQIVDKD